MWKQHEKLKQVPNAYLPAKIYSYGRRGISLRLFRQRYGRADIVEARNIAEALVRSEYRNLPGKTARLEVTSNFAPPEEPGFDESAIRARKDCEKAICEASDSDREALQQYLLTLKDEAKFWRW
jgi:hypothetical protein